MGNIGVQFPHFETEQDFVGLPRDRLPSPVPFDYFFFNWDIFALQCWLVSAVQ